MLGSGALHGAQPVIDLWPEGVPGLKANAGPEKIDPEGRVSNVSHATLTVYRPEHPNGTALIVCPGGSYLFLAFQKEGIEPAQWFNRHGITAFVLKSRLVEYGQPAPLQDILRAIRTVRSQAKTYALAPDRIGVLGFSAGGHLAGSAGTRFADPLGQTGAPLDAVSARPDFLMLIYPVITMEDPFAHPASRQALLGAQPSPELKAHWSLDQQVTADTPPTFLVATEEDKTVPVKNALLFYEALLKAHVSAELHLFAKGPHGFGLRLTSGPTALWPERAVDWMTAHGWIPPESH
jgi:acetyl esterase/lipase